MYIVCLGVAVEAQAPTHGPLRAQVAFDHLQKPRFVPDAVQQIRELTVILHEGALKEHELRPAIRELPLQLLELHLKPVQVTLIWVGWERHAYRPREARMETRSAYGRAKTGTQS